MNNPIIINHTTCAAQPVPIRDDSTSLTAFFNQIFETISSLFSSNVKPAEISNPKIIPKMTPKINQARIIRPIAKEHLKVTKIKERRKMKALLKTPRKESVEIQKPKKIAVPKVDPLALTNSEKRLAASNLIRWGLVGAGLCGMPASIIYPASVITNFATEAANGALNPKKDAFLQIILPIFSNILSDANPWVKGFIKAASLYNLGEYTLTKLTNVWNEYKTNSKGAIQAGAIHLFNLASGVIFAAENIGLFKFPTLPSEKSDSPCQPDSREKCIREITIGTAYINDPLRDEQAKLVDANHKEYAEKWGLKHIVIQDPSLIKDQCKDPRGILGFLGFQKGDCSSNWIKIAGIREWLKTPKNPDVQEEWQLVIDDATPITNQTINSNQVINTLREGNDASVILMKASREWPKISMNQSTDPQTEMDKSIFLVRKDARAQDFFDQVWETRNMAHNEFDPYCPTFGMCEICPTSEEQEGTARVFQNQPKLIGRVVATPKSGDEH